MNPDDAELGAVVESTDALRVRRERELATTGSATVRAITAKVSKAFEGKIQTLVVFENDGDNVDETVFRPTPSRPSSSTATFRQSTTTNSRKSSRTPRPAGSRRAATRMAPLARSSTAWIRPSRSAFTRADQLPIYLT